MTNPLPPAVLESIRPRRAWWWALLIVGIFAAGIRLYYVTHVVVFQPANAPKAHGDAVDYYNYARNLVDHGVFSMHRPGAARPLGDSYRDPGYPVFLAAWMEVLPHWDGWYAAVLFSQAILSALTVVLWMCVGRRWMPLRWIAVAGFVMAIWPHSVAMSTNLMTETVFGFLVALALLVFDMARSRNSMAWAIASGTCFAMAALTNAVLLPFALLLALFLLARRQLGKPVAAALVATVLALTLPWSIRNAMQPADQLSSSDRAMMNLVQGSWPLYHSATKASLILRDPRATQVVDQIDHEIITLENNHVAGLRMMWNRMARAPGGYLLWYLKKPAMLWGWNLRIGAGDIYFHVTYHSPFDVNPFWRGVAAVCRACNFMLMLLALGGCMLAAMRTRPREGMEATALLLLFITAVYSLLQADPRYAIPYRGAEIMLGTFILCRMVDLVGNLRNRTRPNLENPQARAAKIFDAAKKLPKVEGLRALDFPRNQTRTQAHADDHNQ